MIEQLLTQLEKDGVVLLPSLLNKEQLAGMQNTFNAQLKRMRWNHFDGYEKTEPYRHMVENVLLLDQGFVDLALHPIVKELLHRYLGDKFELVEARGWKTLPTKDFHAWHQDAWYEQEGAREIPREVKVAIYLTDVRSGAFSYIKGSHRKQHPRIFRNDELRDVPESDIVNMIGPAGTAFMFDTSGIHRQSVPVLEPRHAVFFNYHDPSVRLQKEDVDAYRYHPLLLNAAFLGNQTDEDRRILGFGNRNNYVPGFERPSQYMMLQNAFHVAYNINLRTKILQEKISAKLKKTLKRQS